MENPKNMRFRKTQVNPDSTIKFDSDSLEIYLAVDEKKDVMTLFKELKIAPTVFKKSIIKLLKLNLLEAVLDGEKSEEATRIFLDRVRDVAVNLSGPVGALLVEDAIKEIKFDASKPVGPQKANLVYKIAAAIPSYKEAKEFKRIMLQELSESQKSSISK